LVFLFESLTTGLLDVLQKSGLKVPKKFRLQHVPNRSREEANDQSPEAEEDHLAALTATGSEVLSQEEGSDFDEENFEMWIEESDVKIKQIFAETHNEPSDSTNTTHMANVGTTSSLSSPLHTELQSRVATLTLELSDLQKKLEEMEQQSNLTKRKIRNLELETEFLSKKLSNTTEKLTERTKQLREVITYNAELQVLHRNIVDATNENTQLRAELKATELELLKARDENVKIDSVVALKNQEFSDLQQTIKLKDETIEKMAQALMKMKARLARSEVECCKFTVEKFFRGYPSSTAHLSIIKDARSKKAHLDVIVNGKRTVWPVSEISEIVAESERNKFAIVFKDRNREIFMSNVRDNVVKELKECLAML